MAVRDHRHDVGIARRGRPGSSGYRVDQLVRVDVEGIKRHVVVRIIIRRTWNRPNDRIPRSV